MYYYNMITINIPTISLHKQYTFKVLECILSVIIFHRSLNNSEVIKITSSTLNISYPKTFSDKINENIKKKMIDIVKDIKNDRTKKISLIFYEEKDFEKWNIKLNFNKSSISPTRLEVEKVLIFIADKAYQNEYNLPSMNNDVDGCYKFRIEYDKKSFLSNVFGWW